MVRQQPELLSQQSPTVRRRWGEDLPILVATASRSLSATPAANGVTLVSPDLSAAMSITDAKEQTNTEKRRALRGSWRPPSERREKSEGERAVAARGWCQWRLRRRRRRAWDALRGSTARVRARAELAGATTALRCADHCVSPAAGSDVGVPFGLGPVGAKGPPTATSAASRAD